MATQEQIETLLKRLKKAPPSEPFKSIDKNMAGIRAILHYLNETNDTVTAGKISEHMGVSTARVAVLLKKMSERGLIEKCSAPGDARVVVVKLSEEGEKTAEKLKSGVYSQVGAMIDKVGMERMLEFAAISDEIHSRMAAIDMEL